MGHSVILFVLFLASSIQSARAQKCDEDKYDNYVFYRTLLLKAEGSAIKLNATRDDFRVEYGRCNADNHASDMLAYYEAYGLNLREVRSDPFRYWLGEQYELNVISTIGNYRVLMASFYDFSKFMNEHVYSAWWTLRARNDINGPKGIFRQDSWLYFGVWRVTMHGRDFCLYFKSDAPSIRTPDGLEPVDLTVESAEMGQGVGRGVLKIFPDFTLDAREVVTFPAENPNARN